MTKLKNTQSNKVILIGTLLVSGALVGMKMSKKDKSMRVPLIITGSLVGLFIYSGVKSWIIEDETSNANIK
jgi:hypothetical protein